jgi:ATP-binding cassette subfamily C protein LapB
MALDETRTGPEDAKKGVKKGTKKGSKDKSATPSAASGAGADAQSSKVSDGKPTDASVAVSVKAKKTAKSEPASEPKPMSEPTPEQALQGAAPDAPTGGGKPGAEAGEPPRQWNVNPSAVKLDAHDPLLGCLVFLTRYYEQPRSPEALIAGLPVETGGISPDLFQRAANRVGFSTRIVRRGITKIPDFSLPVVLLLRDHEACVLTRKIDANNYEIMVPESGARQQMSLEALDEVYGGYAIFVGQEYAEKERLGANALRLPKRSWFWGTMGHFWPTYGQVIIASLVINSFALVLPLFMMNVYDRVVPNNAIETLWVLAIGAGTAIAFDFLIRMMRGYFVDSVGKRADVLLSSRIFEQVQNIQMSSKPGSAGAFANVLRDFESVREFLTSATVTAFADIPFIALFILVIWFVGGPIAIIPAVAVPIIILGCLILQKPLKSAIARSQMEAAQKHGILVESIGGLETIKSLNAQGRLQSKWERFADKTAESGLRVRVLSLGVITFTVFMQQAAAICVIIYGAHLIQDGSVTMGGLIAGVILSSRALAPLAQVASLLARMNQSLSALRALDEIMNLPVERPEGKQFLQRPTFQGAISFRDVSFSYPEAVMPALNNVSFTIAPGEKVAFIGRVGSGKSTVAKILLGLYTPDSGAVLLDRSDLRQLDPIDVRRNMGAILQDNFLFHGTVRENIALGAPNVSDQSVLKAAVTAGVHEFVRHHPSGYDLPVGEGGGGLSGGQRQAVALARALVSEPPILILDEPTSGIDTGTEKAFVTRLTQSLKKRTLVLVTHRASLLPLVDRIIILDQGRVVADGSREEILASLKAGEIKVETV